MATAFIILLCGCGSSSDSSSINAEATSSEAGYYKIEPVSYTLKLAQQPVDRIASEAMIFYSYHPGNEIRINGKTKQPLFVFLNGGPGCATTLNLFAMNTAPYTLDRERTGGAMCAENPYSWTTMGNLLYIDAPNTGFSYNNMENIDNAGARFREFLSSSYNPYIDAAQVIRTILRFLSEHKNIAANDVILVGESYGGTRVSTMLNMLLFRQKYTAARGGVYQDDKLVRLIEDHFNKYFHGEAVTPELVAKQFGRQILIEPQLTGPYQDEVTEEAYLQADSIIYQLAKEEGLVWDQECKNVIIPTTSCLTLAYIPDVLNRDPYIYTKKKTWSDDIEAHSTQALLDVDVLSTVLDVSVGTISKMLPDARKKTCRISSLMELISDEYDEFGIDLAYSGNIPTEFAVLLKEALKSVNYTESLINRHMDNSLEKVFGKLKSWDRYLMGTNLSVFVAYSLESWINKEHGKVLSPDMSTLFGEMFLNNLALVKTFLTDAELDLIIYSPALPRSFKKYTGIVQDVQTVRGKDDHDRQNPGSVTISYVPDSLTDVDTTPESRTIYYPYYASSGHSVSSSQPEEFRRDVMNWLSAE